MLPPAYKILSHYKTFQFSMACEPNALSKTLKDAFINLQFYPKSLQISANQNEGGVD